MLDSGKSIEEYLQAIFRSQNPDQDNNKENCYVFDFNPQRALTMTYEICENTDKSGKKPVSDTIREYLDYAQILDHRGNTLEEVNTEEIMESFRAHGSFSEKFANIKNIDIEKIDDDIINSVLNVKPGKRGKTVEVNDNDVVLGKNIMQQQREKDGKDKKVDKSEVKKVLQKIATVLSNVPEFLFDTPNKETTVEDILNTSQKDLFDQVTGLSIEDFKMWFEKGLLNPVLMNRNIEHFMESEMKLMEDPSGEKIEKFTKQHFNMRAEEGKTPLPLVNEMLNKLPKSTWKDSNKKFCDPCMGTGTFLLEIKERLMEGLKSKIKDPEDREKHILENMMWGVDLDLSKTLIAEKLITNNIKENNLENKDSLNLNPNDMPKFDVVVGNPPYQEFMGKSMTTKKLYIPISKIANEIGNTVVFIIPFNAFSKTHKKEMKDFANQVYTMGLKEIDIFSEEYSKKYFPEVLIRGGICIYIKENGYTGDTIVRFDNGSKIKKDIKENPSFLKYGENFEIIKKIKNNTSQTLGDYFLSEFVGTSSDYFKKEKTDEKDVLCYVSKNKFKSGKAYILFNKLDNRKKYINYWKFATLYVEGNPDVYKIVKPGEVYSHSYSGLIFETKNKLDNFLSFHNTKLFKFIYLNEKPFSNLNTKNFYNYFPAVDFSEKWSDKKLYEFFNLSKEEIDFLESKIN